ncbi:unnamed protein product [Polarella glacialis]|uniref:Protein kinase domain-containing protein n=1 Tax=Polarella glacialis TaxID=89957 RepID=A0A813GY92_POLGL|nr:unnamed protein product [Polarella glacialis]CAE8656998.1 unnamed protein product [Polarella glacialis]
MPRLEHGTVLCITTHPLPTATAAWLEQVDKSGEVYTLSILELLGEGAFSQVYRLGQTSLALLENGEYAVKVIQKTTTSQLGATPPTTILQQQQEQQTQQTQHNNRRETTTTTTTQQLQQQEQQQQEATSAAVREAEILRLVSGCKNVMAIYGLFHASDAELLVMELCECSLSDQLTLTGPFNELEAASLMTAVFAALAYIHERGVVHRDVKASNILISAQDGRALLSDFGLAVQLEQTHIHWRCGTPGWIAPEIIKNNKSKRNNNVIGSSKVDVFAAGVLLYFMLTASMLFKGKTWMQQTLDFQPDFGEEGELAGKSRECVNLIRQLIEKDPDRRPPAEEAARHVWFKIASLGADIVRKVSSGQKVCFTASGDKEGSGPALGQQPGGTATTRTPTITTRTTTPVTTPKLGRQQRSRSFSTPGWISRVISAARQRLPSRKKKGSRVSSIDFTTLGMSAPPAA